MAETCPICKAIYSSKSSDCPKPKCIAKRKAAGEAEKERLAHSLASRKRTRRPLRRGKFTR